MAGVEESAGDAVTALPATEYEADDRPDRAIVDRPENRRVGQPLEQRMAALEASLNASA